MSTKKDGLAGQIEEVYRRDWHKMSPAEDKARAITIRALLQRSDLSESDRRLCSAELRAIGNRMRLREWQAQEAS